jgi:hypothetical protein
MNFLRGTKVNGTRFSIDIVPLGGDGTKSSTSIWQKKMNDAFRDGDGFVHCSVYGLMPGVRG